MRVEIVPSPKLEDREAPGSRASKGPRQPSSLLSGKRNIRPDEHGEEQRLRFILQAQRHCDHFLRHIADPAGKSVLVLGAGAGTEMLWCLRNGAKEVLGIDILAQDPGALQRAVVHAGVDPDIPFEMRQMPIEDAPSLGRRFDLLLSNNVFEHLPRLEDAFQACAQLLEPDRGRLAIFTDPLYYSSTGSHLPLEPWEHLWGDETAMRQRLLDHQLPADHCLHKHDLDSYLHREISLNRMRLADFLEAARAAGLLLLNLRLERDRNLIVLPEYYRRMIGELGADATPAVMDLALEGIYAELALPDLQAEDREIEDETTDLGLVLPVLFSTEELRRQRDRDALVEQIHNLGASLQEVRQQAEDERRRKLLALSERDDERRQKQQWQQTARRVREVLQGVEASASFQLGRALTAPLRWLRDLLRTS